MTSLLDRRITAASDDGVCRWHAAKLWQTRAKLSKLNLICIVSCTTSKNVLKFGLLIKKNLNVRNLSSTGKRTARFLLAGACVSYVACLHCVACVALDGNASGCLPAWGCSSWLAAAWQSWTACVPKDRVRTVWQRAVHPTHRSDHAFVGARERLYPVEPS